MAHKNRNKLLAWRERQQFSLEEVAGLTGFTSAMLSFVERGRRNFSAQGKVLVSRRLGVPLRELFEVERVREYEASTKRARR